LRQKQPKVKLGCNGPKYQMNEPAFFFRPYMKSKKFSSGLKGFSGTTVKLP